MGQTIICEYLAAWESTGVQPDPTAFGFDGLYSMLEECQDTMLKLGTVANDGRRRIAELETALNGVVADKQRNEVAQYDRITELQSEVAAYNALSDELSTLSAQIRDVENSLHVLTDHIALHVAA
jgi:hypothetical protein